MNKYNAIFLICFLLILSAFSLHVKHRSGYELVKEMFGKTVEINTLVYSLSKQERINGKMVKQVTYTKMVKNPFKVYVRQSYPKDGVEVLYVEGSNDNKALVNPGGFPWINVKMDPRDGMMRNDQHHTIFQSGFDHVISILEFLCNKYKGDIDNIVQFNGMVKYKDRECYSITFDNPNFKYIDYTVKEGENIDDIAARMKLSGHMILEKNKSVKDYKDVKPGQTITIPNDYSPKLLLYLDKDALLPLRMDVYDDQGLYEKYEYFDIELNPPVVEGEFLEDFPKYGF